MSPSSPAGSSSSSLPDSNALLALPDGPIPSNHPDRSSYTISSTGGYPTFPVSSLPSTPTFTCGVCAQPIPLLAQVYCPPEEGENDRTLYVFACARGGCQRKQGAVRAWRASRRNEEYVRDVEKRRKAREEEERRIAEEKRKNPFTISGPQPNGSALFGQPSTGLFGASNPFSSPSDTGSTTAPSTVDATPDISSLSIESTASITLAPPHPAYLPPQYLSTTDEYLPPPEEMDIDEGDDDEEAAQEKAGWKDERWEQLLPSGQDPLFERFVKRIGDADGADDQVLRYDLGGIPLPYSSTSQLTTSLFPGLAAACKAQKPEDDDPPLSAFYKPNASGIPACPQCKGERVFELQLVPSLINHLSPDSLSTTGKPVSRAKSKQTEEERKAELARLAGEKGAGGEADGMEWGTVLVFGCKADCVGLGEEWVGVEWETVLEQATPQK